jgi:hypothetical protein
MPVDLGEALLQRWREMDEQQRKLRSWDRSNPFQRYLNKR